MAKVKSRGGIGAPGVNTPDPPQGYAPPQGVAEGSTQFYDWLATQGSAIREWWIEGRFNSIAGKADPTARKKEARAEQDRLQQAQEKAISQGKSLPDVNPLTGQGVHFSSDKQREEFMSTAAVQTGAKTAKTAEQITPEQVTINPTQIPVDQAAAHPEDVVQKYGAVTPEQVNNETRTDTTGLAAQKASIADETAAINQGGLTAIDRASIEQARMKRGMEARAQEQAIMQQAEQQGRAGSPVQLLARNQAQQAAENARSQDDLQTMALGLQRKDTLMSNRASQGATMQTAQDALDQFNAKGAQDRAQRLADEQRKRETGNVDITNKALGAGMEYRTGLAAQNTGITNTAEQLNKGPEYGPRALVATNIAAHEPVIAGQQASAGFAHDDAIRQAALDAQSKTAGLQFGGNLIGSLASAGTSLFTNPFKQPNTGGTGGTT